VYFGVFKNSRDIIIFALHCRGCRKKNVGVQEESAFKETYLFFFFLPNLGLMFLILLGKLF